MINAAHGPASRWRSSVIVLKVPAFRAVPRSGLVRRCDRQTSECAVKSAAAGALRSQVRVGHETYVHPFEKKKLYLSAVKVTVIASGAKSA